MNVKYIWQPGEKPVPESRTQQGGLSRCLDRRCLARGRCKECPCCAQAQGRRLLGEPGDHLPESGLGGVRETFGLFPTFGQNLGLNVSLSVSNEGSSSRIHRPKGLPRVPESPDTMSRTLHTSGVCIFLRLSAAFCEVGGPSATVGWLVTAPPAATLGPDGGFAATP